MDRRTFLLAPLAGVVAHPLTDTRTVRDRREIRTTVIETVPVRRADGGVGFEPVPVDKVRFILDSIDGKVAEVTFPAWRRAVPGQRVTLIAGSWR